MVPLRPPRSAPAHEPPLTILWAMTVVPSPFFESGHPSLQAPADAGARLWRYMDFTKFVSLLSTKSLWFSRSSMLGDPWEGAYTRANLERRLAEISSLRNTARMSAADEDRFIRNLVATERSIYVNCWHMSEIESAAMWRLYLSSGAGVAIESTWERLVSSLGEPEHPATKMIGGRVRYLDPEAAPVDPDDIALNGFSAHGIKRPSFSHEREVRLMFWALDPANTSGMTSEITLPGIRVPVELTALVQGIRLSPLSPAWFMELVQDVARRYGFSASVRPSDLDREPTQYRLRPPSSP